VSTTEDTIRYRIIRDRDDPDRPVALVETIGDLVRLEVRNGDHPPESILIHPAAARYVAAALVLESWRAEAVGLAARLDEACEGEGGGL
jgi:hypothetical protein